MFYYIYISIYSFEIKLLQLHGISETTTDDTYRYDMEDILMKFFALFAIKKEFIQYFLEEMMSNPNYTSCGDDILKYNNCFVCKGTIHGKTFNRCDIVRTLLEMFII